MDDIPAELPPTPPRAGHVPPAAPPPPPPPPPPTGGAGPHTAGFTTRYGLVRPQQGRYLAGVCAAIGRATNTDPVLWRVLLAVLGLFGGVGVLVYLTAWLIIPGEGDTASPLESMLGRGRSNMSPLTVILLSLLVAVSFGFVVTNSFRATLLGAAILIGGAILLNRNRTDPGQPVEPVPHVSPGEPIPHVSPGEPVWTAGAAARPPVPPAAYRPPFAPHGPYGPHGGPPMPYPPPVRSPRPPRERSPLGAATFSTIFVVLGVLALLDTARVFDIGASAYFAAALATIAVGLLVGTWFGRARWLIALGLATTVALGISTLGESYHRVRDFGGNVTWAPADRTALADRYESRFGNAVLDLRAVTFTDQETRVTVDVSFGNATVLVPPNVDVTTVADVRAGNAWIFGVPSGQKPIRNTADPNAGTTNVGTDGPGGGRLRLIAHVKAGKLEVTR